MKTFIKYTLPVFAIAGLLSSCEPELDAPAATAGSASFERYYAFGNSLTAGYASGGLSREGQINSYPNILAQQFKLLGGGGFSQPLFTEDQRNGSGYLTLTGFTAAGSPVLTSVTTNLAYRGGTTLGNQPLLTKYTDPVNNYGVPGMSVLTSAEPVYSALNNFFERLVTSPGATSYLNVAAATNPTFFTCWLGNNDVLTYATAGGHDNPMNPFDGITDTAAFRVRYNLLIDTLTTNNSNGVVANIPYVTAVPFFTTVTLSRVLAAAPAGAQLHITTGDGNTRVATTSDLILLTTQAAIGRPDTVAPGVVIPHGFHPANPLLNSEVLDTDEAAKARAATDYFNEIIRKAADRKNLGLVNMNSFLKSLDQGPLFSNGVANTSSFVSGNLFSLDGIHLTPRGNAFVANEFIRVINSKYGANIPQVNPNSYPGVRFP